MRPDPYAWSADLDGLVVVGVLFAAYLATLRAFPAPRRRVALFSLGLALVLITHVSPVAGIANNYLLSIHLLQNVVLAEWAPALCLAGLSPALAAQLARLPGMRVLTHPLVALPLWLAVYFAWHLPWVYDAALERPDTLLHLEHASYFAAGALFWWPVFHEQPHRISDGAKAGYIFGAFVLASPLGLLLALLPTAIYDFYATGPGLWGLSALTDQQIAGVSMAAEQAVVFFAVFAYYVARFMRGEETPEAAIS